MLPWSEMFRAAIRAGLSPKDFWNLSVREWFWLCEESASRLDMPSLKKLMELYPDGRI